MIFVIYSSVVLEINKEIEHATALPKRDQHAWMLTGQFGAVLSQSMVFKARIKNLGLRTGLNFLLEPLNLNPQCLVLCCLAHQITPSQRGLL